MGARAGTGLAMMLALTSCATAGPADPAAEPWVAPENRWPSHRPPAGLVGEGFGIGEVVEDLRLRDQHDDETAIWQFYGEVVLVTISAVWCVPCRALAEEAEAVVASYAGEGVVLVTVLEEDAGGLTPELSDAVGWAETYGAAGPVLADPDGLFAPAVGGAFPMVLIIGRDLVVYGGVGGGTADDLRRMIDIELAR